jgi:hypothetical protein
VRIDKPAILWAAASNLQAVAIERNQDFIAIDVTKMKSMKTLFGVINIRLEADLKGYSQKFRLEIIHQLYDKVEKRLTHS